MKLSTVEITNFRCFRSFSLDLHPAVNLLVGANGAGKTALLKAIATSLIGVVAAGSRALPDPGLKPSDMHVPAGSGNAPEARATSIEFKVTARDFYGVPRFPNATTAGDAATLEWKERFVFQPPARLARVKQPSNGTVSQYFDALRHEIEEGDGATRVPLPVVAYYGATRGLREMPKLGNVLDVELSPEGAYRQALDAATDFKSACQWFYLRENAELRERAQAGPEASFEYPDLKAAREALRRIIQGFVRVYFDGNPPRLKVALANGGAAEEFHELSQLSDGYRGLLALVLDFARRLAQANPRWPNPLEAPGILLIDEVELHLHPRWQQTVLPDLRAVFPNTQVVATTHSPAVLTTVRRENIRLLDADHQIHQLPADLGTYGADAARILAEVFAAPTRPERLEPVQQLDEYLALVESQRQDCPRGRELRKALEAALGAGDPDLQRANMRVSQLKALRGR